MDSKNIETIAEQSLSIVGHVASRAKEELVLLDIGYTNEVLATSNSITDNAYLSLMNASSANEKDYCILLNEPAFMRVDLEDIDGNYSRSIYFSKVAVPTGMNSWREKKIDFISYRSQKGQIASLPCGNDCEINKTEYYISKKVQFTPKEIENLWDCINIDIISEHKKLSLDSFRQLIVGSEELGMDVDAYLEQLKESGNTIQGKIKKITRNMRSGMSLRSQPSLDQYQDKIFRLPINSQKIILGPPGTGKTTTLIKRLGQKLDSSEGSFIDSELYLLKKLGKDGKGFSDWIMFTPSELLKSYLIKAFNYEGIAIRDNLKTWEYSRNIARQNFNILNSNNSTAGFALEKTLEYVKSPVVGDPRIWYSSFLSYFESALDKDLRAGLKLVVQASGLEATELIEKLTKIIDNDDSISSKYQKLFELENQAKKLIDKEKDLSDKVIKAERNLLINKNPEILEEMAKFLKSIKIEADEDEDEDDDYDDDEVEEHIGSDQKIKALAIYVRFLKKIARYAYLKKTLPKNKLDQKLKEWLGDKLPSDDTLIGLGRSISLQNGLRHNLNCWKRLYRKVVSSYKKFRKQDVYKHFYQENLNIRRISQTELDLLLLVSFRNIKKLLTQPYVVRNIDETRFQELKGLRDGLFKDQIMVDEATDFSPLQLACMEAMTNPLLNSFFACGDFNQRLTNQGIKNSELLAWISPKLEQVRINTIYRQSPKLNEFTHALLDLMDDSDLEAKSELPKFIDFEGLKPVLVEYSSDVDETALWITKRVAEIENLVNSGNEGGKVFPSIVVLVKDEATVSIMASYLNDYLEDYNLKADACLQGKSVGDAQDIRVCSIEFIKGLEFEAVFFVGIDELIELHPNLYQKYLYVGATRAANYLGVTCVGNLPDQLERLRPLFNSNWDIEEMEF